VDALSSFQREVSTIGVRVEQCHIDIKHIMMMMIECCDHSFYFIFIFFTVVLQNSVYLGYF
jgi:hypothetical protein